MSCFWELNGVKLKGDNTRIIVTALSYERRHRQSLTDIHNGSQDRQGTGIDLPTHRITFSLIGDGNEKYQELDAILDVIDTTDNPSTTRDDTWTLQAPSDLNVYLWKDYKRTAFTTQSLRIEIVSKAKIELIVEAINLGPWIADGGDYCEKITGSFELTSTGPNVYTLSNGTGLEDQDGDATGTTPLITLPEQTSGYPTAVNATTFVEDTLSPASTSTTTIDGNTVTLETYDLTGYLIPAPSVAGDVGLFEVCSSPTDSYLSGGEGLVNFIDFGVESAFVEGFYVESGTAY